MKKRSFGFLLALVLILQFFTFPVSAYLGDGTTIRYGYAYDNTINDKEYCMIVDTAGTGESERLYYMKPDLSAVEIPAADRMENGDFDVSADADYFIFTERGIGTARFVLYSSSATHQYLAAYSIKTNTGKYLTLDSSNKLTLSDTDDGRKWALNGHRILAPNITGTRSGSSGDGYSISGYYCIDLNESAMQFEVKSLSVADIAGAGVAEYFGQACQHSGLVTYAAKSPTCTEAGNVGYYYCPTCRNYYADDNCSVCIWSPDTLVLPAPGHTDDDDDLICDVCLASIPEMYFELVEDDADISADGKYILVAEPEYVLSVPSEPGFFDVFPMKEIAASADGTFNYYQANRQGALIFTLNKDPDFAADDESFGINNGAYSLEAYDSCFEYIPNISKYGYTVTLEPGGTVRIVSYFDMTWGGYSDAELPSHMDELKFKAHETSEGTFLLCNRASWLEPYTECPLYLYRLVGSDEHVHSFGEWEKQDDNLHTRSCSCGETETAEHTWNSGIATAPATHLTEGEKTYTCTACGATRTETVEKTQEHVFGDWERLNATLHIRSCPCGENETAEHTWEPSSVAAGTYICTVCGATKTESDGNGETLMLKANQYIRIAVNNGNPFPAGTVFEATQLPEAEVEQVGKQASASVALIGENAQMLAVYDLTLDCNGVEIQPDGTVSVTLPAPDGIDSGAIIRVVYIASDGTAEPMETLVNDDGTVTFMTDHFSRYAIVAFTALNDASAVNPEITFTDVSPDRYYADAVVWAVSQGITNGTGNGTFSPETNCTRAQVVTFLYRAFGSPAVTQASDFADVPADAYYADAVAWAVANGITNGTGSGFEPNATVTRAQFVTFLWRAAGKPAAEKSAGFADVPDGAYYTDAVAWAVANGITNGTGSGFEPNSPCNRGQVVTFLHRYFSK